MKSQRLGLVLGMNVAVACLVMQGCKVTRPGEDNLPPPALDPAVSSTTTTTVVEPEPAPAPKTATISVVVEPAPEKPAALPPPAPSKVAQVKPLPPPAAKKPAKPAVAPAKPAVAPAGSSTVVVQRGDTLSGICVRNHVKMSAVVAANPGIDPNRIRVGQKIVLPGVASVAVAAAKPAPAAAKDAKVMPAAANLAANTTPPPVKTKAAFKPYTGATKAYKVRSGDSLGKIAYENGITIRALKDLNKLTKDSIRVGQELQIPAEKVVAEKPAPAAKAAPDAKKDAVKKAAAPAPEAAKKDEAKKPFAKKAEAEKPAESTSLSNAVEKAEAAPAPEAPKAEPAPAAEPAPEVGSTYVAKDGDDIVSIAIMYNLTPGRLLDLNDLKAGDPIKPGQVIKLPPDAKLSAQ